MPRVKQSRSSMMWQSWIPTDPPSSSECLYRPSERGNIAALSMQHRSSIEEQPRSSGKSSGTDSPSSSPSSPSSTCSAQREREGELQEVILWLRSWKHHIRRLEHIQRSAWLESEHRFLRLWCFRGCRSRVVSAGESADGRAY